LVLWFVLDKIIKAIEELGAEAGAEKCGKEEFLVSHALKNAATM